MPRDPMINDYAFVGETISQYPQEKGGKTHITRSGGLWSKPLGLAVNIKNSERYLPRQLPARFGNTDMDFR